MNLDLKQCTNLEYEEVIKNLDSSVNGITNNEAEKRANIYGLNEITEKKKESLIIKILKILLEPMVIILLVASLFSFIIKDILEGFIIIGVVVVNTIISLIQENKAEKAVEELKKIISNQFKVLRNGIIEVINSKFIVPGDIIIFESGDIIPADARIIEANNLLVDESHLTGESKPINKNKNKIKKDNPQLYEMENISFSGSKVLQGTGKAIVIKSGNNTEIGKIARNISEIQDEKTPLQRKLEKEIKFLVGLAFFSAFFVLLVFILKNLGSLNFFIAKEAILIAVTIMVAVFPEGLPASITIALSLAVERLSKNSTIVKKLSSVETLGNVDYICTDKTGTLTQNKMSVKEFFIDNKFLTMPDIFKLIADGKIETIYDIFLISNKCSSATIEIDETTGNIVKEVGDPTETALLKASFLAGFDKKIFINYNTLDIIPFSSELMYSMTLVRSPDKKVELIGKGAPEKVIELSSYYIFQNKMYNFDKSKKEHILKEIERYSEKGFRLIAFMKKELKDNKNNKINKEDIKDFIFLGCAIIYDPPKDEVKEVIKSAKSANINIVMITGDSKKTGFNIAESVGIASSIEEAIEGRDLEKMDDEEFKNKVEKIRVYSRVQPLDKLKIVDQLKKNNHIVAMTGDGVNDAPALKKADIGIAMGKAGSQVSQEASEIILTDDNFTTIITAIKEGRNLFFNLKKLVRYLIVNNIGKVITLILSPIFGPGASLTAIQVLLTNLIMETAPSVALSIEKGDESIMTKKPAKINEPIFSLKERILMIIEGIIFGLCITTGYLLTYNYLINSFEIHNLLIEKYQNFNIKNIDGNFIKNLSKSLAQTVAFLITLLSPQLYIFMLRDGSFFKKFTKPNKLLKLFSIFIIFTIILIVYLPFLSIIFSTVPIYDFKLWIIVGVFSIITPLFKYIIGIFRKD